MALQKDTKTVLLHAGMQDHVDDFLIESPAVEYVENGRFDKDGVISKRNGFEALESNGLDPDDDGAPTVIAGGASLVVPFAGGVSTYDPDTAAWRTTTTEVTFTSVERVYSTEAAAAGDHYHIGKVGENYVVVYEASSDNALAPEDCTVVIEVVAPSGVAVARWTVEGYYPQVAVPSAATNHAIVTYLEDAVGGEDLKVVRVNTEAKTLSATRTQLSLGVAASEHYICPDITSVPVAGRSFANWAPARANYKLAPTQTGAVVVYFTDDAAPVLRYRLIASASPTAAPTLGTATTLTTLPTAGHPTNDTIGKVLDAHFRGTSLFVLYSYYVPNDNTVPDPDVAYLKVTDGSTTQQLDAWSGYKSGALDPEDDMQVVPIYTCGTLVSDGTTLWAAWSGLGMSDDGGISLVGRDDPAGVSYTQIATMPVALSAETTRHRYVGWRLASKFALDGDTAYLALQQNLQRCITTARSGGSAGDLITVASSSTPLTTYLCKVTTSALTPVAALSANKGVVTSPGGGATASTLPECLLTGEVCTTIVPVQEEAAVANFETGGEDIDDVFAGAAGSRRAEVWSVVLDVTPPVTSVGDNVLFASGIPLWFDGQRFVENTPLTRPEILWVYGDNTTNPLQPDPAPGNLDDVHAVQCTYSYTDKNGTTHRSAPGSVTYIPKNPKAVVADPTSDVFSLYVTSPLSAMPSEDYLTLEVYLLTEDVYKRVATKTVPAYVSSGSYVTVDVRLAVGADTVVSTGRALYTEGGVLPADPIPYCNSFVHAAGRLVGVTDDPRSTLVYSKPLETNVSPEFPAAFSFPLPPGLRVVGVAGLDDKIVVFAEDSVYVVYGQGPSASGRGAAFATFRLPTPVGCLDPKSVVETPDGIMFRGRRGFYMLKRDLSIGPILGASDILEGRSVVSATPLTKYGEVRFLLETTGTTVDSDGPTPDSTRPPTPKYGNSNTNNPALVYNYERNQWSVFSNYEGVSAALLNGEYCRLRSDYSVWRETPGEYSDPSGSNLLKIITPWIKLRNLQDFGRIYKATFLGRYLSAFTEDDNGDLDAGDITIKAAYDYEKNDTQTKVWRASEELQPELRDGQSVGADRLQVVFVPKRQKCSAIRFTLEETPTADADGLTYRTGRGWEIPAIDLEVGMRSGSNKSLSAQRKK